MSQLFFKSLLSMPAQITGIAIIALFAIVGVMVGARHDGMNAPALNSSKDQMIFN